MNDISFHPLQSIARWFGNWQWLRGKNYLSRWFYQFFGRDKAKIYVDTDNLAAAYYDCPHLRIVINRIAKMASNAQFKLVKINDENEDEIKNHWVKDLIKNPTPFQNTEQWVQQYIIEKLIFANVFLNKNIGLGTGRIKTLWILPSENMRINLTGKFFKQTKLSEIIESYTLQTANGEELYREEEVVYIADNFSFNEGRGVSQLISLKLPVSNIIAALETRNIIIVDKGMIGFISGAQSDKFGGSSIGLEESKRIRDEFAEQANLYSAESKIRVVESPVTWQAMSYPTKDLMLFEELEDCAAQICDAFGAGKYMFSWFKDSTFENYRQAVISTYQNTIQPLMDELCGILNEQLNLSQEGLKLIADFSWLQIMKEDELLCAQKEKVKADTFSLLYKDGIISRETYATLAGVELSESEISETQSDSLGKIPLALQQLALARERANTAGVTELVERLGQATNILLERMLNEIETSVTQSQSE